MRALYSFALILGSALPAFSQQPAASAPGLPKDPREVFATAAPFYDFSSASMKPWHLKATYQLYDENGKPAEQGTFEYWWASSDVHRSTWTRTSATQSEWDTADGRYAILRSGQSPSFFEYKLKSALLSPLPRLANLDPEKTRLQRKSVTSGNGGLECIMVAPKISAVGVSPMGLFPTYCFDSQKPVLLASYSFGSLITQFGHVVKMDDNYLAREISISEGAHKLLTANVDSITELSASDPALAPSADATFHQKAHSVAGESSHPVQIPEMDIGKGVKAFPIISGLTGGTLLKKPAPFYPQDAKDARISGTVQLNALIGRDGNIHDLKVISTPSPSLAESSLLAASQWQYKPYLLNGAPVEVETTINIIFTLNR